MKKYFYLFCNALLVMLAVFSGGAVAMAMAVGTIGSDTDPNEGNTLATATKDDPGKGIDAQSKSTTGSAMRDAGLVLDEINDYVTQFRAYQFPMHTDFLTRAKQIKVDTKEPSNYEIGEAILDCVTESGYTALDDNQTPQPVYNTSINLASYLFDNDKKLFSEGCTILCPTIVGYNAAGAADGSPLVLYCTAKDSTNITVVPLNGPINQGTMFVPAFASGTKLQVMAPALSESEVEVAPDSAYPAEVKHYLQKKACAITWTELFERIKKKANWNVQDIKDWQLAMFRKKCTRTMLIGVQSRRMKTNSKTGTEYVYTQQGCLRQLRLGYQISGNWTFEDLIGITKMLFGRFATTSEIDVYVGPDAMEKIANINFSSHPEITVSQKLNNIGVGMTSITTPFGTLNLKLEHALADIGLSAYALALNMSDAKRLYYESGKTITIDREKGEGGEVREAKSQYYIQDDCLVIKGYNSMLIGPNISVAGFSNIGSTVTTHSTTNALPSNPTAGSIYYFTDDVTVTSDSDSTIYPKGLWKYNGSAFVAYEGVING